MLQWHKPATSLPGRSPGSLRFPSSLPSCRSIRENDGESRQGAFASAKKAKFRCARNWPSRSFPSSPRRNSGLAIGVLAVAAQYALPDVDPLLPKDRPAVPLAFCGADEQVELIRKRREPSVVAVVSVSEGFLRTAQSLLEPALGRWHAVEGFLLPLSDPKTFAATDVVFADSLAVRKIKHRGLIAYRLVAPAFLAYLAGAMKSQAST